MQTFELASQNVSGYQPLCIKCSKGYILEVGFIYLHLIALATAATAAPGLPASTAGGGAVFGVGPAAEELDIVGDDVDLASLGAVLGLPGAVL